jgi:hypothetical protein
MSITKAPTPSRSRFSNLFPSRERKRPDPNAAQSPAPSP